MVPTDRDTFVQWLNNIQLNVEENWMLAGDFNFYISTSDRNRDGGNMNGIMIFNEIISNLGLMEIPLKGRNFTWSNIQSVPLLEQIDWVFTPLKAPLAAWDPRGFPVIFRGENPMRKLATGHITAPFGSLCRGGGQPRPTCFPRGAAPRLEMPCTVPRGSLSIV